MIQHASPVSIAAILALSLPAFADESHDHPSAAAMDDAVTSATDAAINAPFDIVAAHVHREGRTATFLMTLAGDAGSQTPEPTGALGGAPVLSYVWPTSLDPSTVGFEGGTGILALAATSHPDFDDTPLFDENGDGNLINDGAEWHSHWVVLTPTEACGEGALGVRDVAEFEMLPKEKRPTCQPLGRACPSSSTAPVSRQSSTAPKSSSMWAFPMPLHSMVPSMTG